MTDNNSVRFSFMTAEEKSQTWKCLDPSGHWIGTIYVPRWAVGQVAVKGEFDLLLVPKGATVTVEMETTGE